MRKNVKRINMSLYMKHKQHEKVYRFMEEQRKYTGKNFNAILIDAVQLYMYYKKKENLFIGMESSAELGGFAPDRDGEKEIETETKKNPNHSTVSEVENKETEEIDAFEGLEGFEDFDFEEMQFFKENKRIKIDDSFLDDMIKDLS